MMKNSVRSFGRALFMVGLVAFGVKAQSSTPVSSPDAAVATPAPAASPTASTTSPSKAVPVSAANGTVVVPAEKSKPIILPRFDKPPTIDGKLDEDVWQKAVVEAASLATIFPTTNCTEP